MKTLISFLCCLLFAVCCLADVTVTPNSGTETGGDLITISGLPSCTSNCQTPSVRFGGAVSPKVTIVADGTVQAITPPHGRATVDITVDGAVTHDAFTYVAAGTLVNANFERILIPLSLGANRVPGAHDSLWASELWIYNGNKWPGELLFGNPDGTCCASPVIATGETRNGQYVASVQSPFGLVMWAQKGSTKGYTFSLQVRDVSRAKLHSGTEMPVVRESEFHDTIDLLNVPIDPASSRTALRIFNLDGSTQLLPVRVTITPMGGTEPLVDDPNVTVKQGPSGGTMRSFARMATLDDLALFYPQIIATPRVQISITTAGSEKIWAFAAVTNNDTQLITTVLPH